MTTLTTAAKETRRLRDKQKKLLDKKPLRYCNRFSRRLVYFKEYFTRKRGSLKPCHSIRLL